MDDDNELDKILVCNCGGNDYLNGKHYDDCAKNLAPKLTAWAAKQVVEAVDQLHYSIMNHELKLGTESDPAFNYARIHRWIDKNKAALQQGENQS